jgi:ABC-type branched-subunit amino acid transport system substrate-binding protein
VLAASLAFATVASCGARFPRGNQTVVAGGNNAGGVTDGGLGGGVVVDPNTGEVIDTGSGGGLTPGSGSGGGGVTGPGGSGSTAAPGTTTGPGGSTTGPSTGPTGGGGGGGGGQQPGAVPAGSTDGISKTNINIAYLIPKTGAAPVPPQVDDGIRAYWTFLNGKGGIFGRKVSVQIYDTTSTDDGARSAAQSAIDNHAAFVVALDRLGVQGTIMRFLDQRGIPNLEVQTPVDVPANMQWTFGITIDHRVQGKMIADYMAHGLKVKKVGVAYETDNTLKPGVDAFKAEAAAQGLQVVASEQIDQSQNQFAPQARKIAASQAQAVWMYMAPIPAANLANTANGIGYHPTWFANNISWNFNLVLTGGYAGLRGARAFSAWPAYTDPRCATYRPRAPRGNPGVKDLGIPGWGLGQILAAAIKNAGPDLGRNSFRNAMQHLQLGSKSPVDGTPLLWSPLRFTDGVRTGASAVVTYKVIGSSSSDAQWAPEADYRTGY